MNSSHPMSHFGLSASILPLFLKLDTETANFLLATFYNFGHLIFSPNRMNT